MPTDKKLTFPVKFAYGIGQAGEGVFGAGLGFFLLFYYSQILGLSPGLAGSAIGIAVMIDAASDIIAGSVSDHWRSRLGRRHPFMYASFLPLSLCFFLLFYPPVSSDWALFLWLAIFTNVARTMLSLYHVPHIALGAEITEDINDRTTLVAYRQFFGNMGYLFGLTAFFLVFSPLSGEGVGRFSPGAYEPWALCCALVIAGTIWWSAHGTRSVIQYLPQPADGPRRPPPDRRAGGRSGVRTRPRSRGRRPPPGHPRCLDIYMITYFWELDDSVVLPVLIAYAIGNALGTTVSVHLFARWGKKACLIVGGFSWAFFQTLPVVLRLLGWFPENGDSVVIAGHEMNLVMLILVVMKVIQGASTAQANVGYGSMMADVCDEHEYQTGRRQEGAFFAAVAFSAKATSGFGAVIAGWALEIIDWPTGADIRTAADVPPETLLNMGLFYGPMIASLGFISVLFYLGYRLTPKRHAQMLVELAERRRQVRAASAAASP